MFSRFGKFYSIVIFLNVLVVAALFYSLYGSRLDSKHGRVSYMECSPMPGRSENLVLNIEGTEYWTILGRKLCGEMVRYSEGDYAEIQYVRHNNYIRSLRLDGRQIFNDRIDSAFSFIWWLSVLLLSNYALIKWVKRSRFIRDGRKDE